MRELVLDTETTGLRLQDDHRLIEIGIIELIDYEKTGRQYHTYLNPRRSVSAGAVEVHGISYEKLADKPEFFEIAGEFLSFIENSPIIMHNAEFDLGFLNAELGRAGREEISNERVIDTLSLSRKFQPRLRSHSLDALCRHFRIDDSNRTLHGALLDAELLADVYLKLLGLDKPVFDLWPEGETAKSRNSDDGWKPGPRRKPLEPRLTEKEAERHAAFVETLGDNALWKQLENR